MICIQVLLKKMFECINVKSVNILATIIDVVMAGKNMINKVMYYSETEKLSPDFYSKLLFDDQLNRLYYWFSLDTKYLESEIMKHILENE